MFHGNNFNKNRGQKMDLQAILEQSISTATFYFTHAIKEVDEIFDEEGFAKKNPEILLE